MFISIQSQDGFLLSRDTAAGDKMNPFAEQEAWEEHQIGKTSILFLLLLLVTVKFI